MFKVLLLSLFFFSFQLLAQPSETSVKSPDAKSKKQSLFNLGNTFKFWKKPTHTETSQNKNSSEGLYLLERLEYLDQTLPKNYPGRKALFLRQAHTLSLIAEKEFIKSDEENCKPCLVRARKQAEKSLSFYKSLDSSLKTHSLLHQEALFRQAYLERLLGNKQKSLAHLNKITQKKSVKKENLTRAWYNIGEIQFELYNYKQALLAFNEVLKFKSPWRAKASYRKIWSLFNLSLYEKSVHQLISFLSSDLDSKDIEIKQKLETETTTIYSYAQITQKRLNWLYDFNKHNKKDNIDLARQQRLSILAEKLVQLGRLKESNQTWKFYLSKTQKPEHRLIAYVSLLNNDLTLNHKDELKVAGQTVKSILSLYEKAPFNQDTHLAIQRFFKKIQSKARSFSKDQKKYLFALTQDYHPIAPDNKEILLLSGYLAEDLKDYKSAVDIYQKLARLFQESKEASQHKMLEQICVKQIEMAELSKDEPIRLKAYNFYVENGKNPSLIFKSRYQIAYIDYTAKRFESASQRFKDLIAYKPKRKAPSVRVLQLKSAHLLLSSLEKIKGREEEFIASSGAFRKTFPKHEKEFTQMYNSAILDFVKKLVAEKDLSHHAVRASTDDEILKAWKTLNLFSEKFASQKDLESYYWNRLLLSKELLKIGDMEKSLSFLLSNKNVKKEDRNTLLAWQLWVSELKFDFKKALKIIKILKPKEDSEEHLLRLTRLSELAGEDSLPYYQKIIEKFPQSPSTPVILNSIIEENIGDRQKKLLQKYAGFFKTNPDQLSYFVLKADQGQMNLSFLESFLTMDFMKDSFLSVFVQRKKTIDRFEKDLKDMQVYVFPDNLKGRRLSQKLKEWANKLNAFSKSSADLLKTEDWTSQVFITFYFKQELDRFYTAVLNLPPPSSLTPEEQVEYKKLLMDQVQPYKQQSAKLENNLNTLKSHDFLQEYKKAIEQDFVFYPYLSWEMSKVSSTLDVFHKNEIQLLLSSVENKNKAVVSVTPKVSETQIKKLYQNIKNNPFDKKALKELLNLEQKRNNKTFSFYLANRIKQLSDSKGVK